MPLAIMAATSSCTRTEVTMYTKRCGPDHSTDQEYGQTLSNAEAPSSQIVQLANTSHTVYEDVAHYLRQQLRKPQKGGPKAKVALINENKPDDILAAKRDSLLIWHLPVKDKSFDVEDRLGEVAPCGS